MSGTLLSLSAPDSRNLGATMTALLLAAFGICQIVMAVSAPDQVPAQSVAAAPAPSSPPSRLQALPYSVPVSLRIPEIAVDSTLVQTGLNREGAPAVPYGKDEDKASWLNRSVTPGEAGTSVIIGHVDTVSNGPSVFYRLSSLRPGSQVYVAREDGRTAVFTISRVTSFPRDEFPSRQVYGGTGHASLRLLTCGGTWDEQNREYSDNIVAFADLSGVQ